MGPNAQIGVNRAACTLACVSAEFPGRAVARRPDGKVAVLLLGPELGAVSGVSTHLNQLFGSSLGGEFDLKHFVVGSEGRQESRAAKLARLLVSPLALAARILRDRPDIVHINVSLDHKSFPRDAVYLAVARLLRRRVVFQIHGGEMPQDLYPSPILREQFVHRVLEAPTVVVLLGSSELAAYSKFVPDKRLEVIPNGTVVDQQAALPQRATTNPLHLVYVGRLVPTKGVAECIAAAHLLRDAGRKFKLTIAGSGPQEAELKAAAGSLIDDKLVEFVGPKFSADKEHLWQDSDVFVFPTRHPEGLPYAVLESMAVGTVPITTGMGALPDVVTDGVDGLIVAPGDPQALFDAIVELDDDRPRLLAMSKESALRIRRDYSVERLADEFGELYRSLVP